MVPRCMITLIVAIAAASGRAQDLPVDHAQWPPKVFSSAYQLIATEAEWRELDTLFGQARQESLERFWVRRDPTPATPENEFREQFRDRVEYALTRYKTVNIRAPWDERGKVYIKFGEPDELQDSVDFWYTHGGGYRAKRGFANLSQLKREYGETWFYFGRNLVLQFQGDDLDYKMVPRLREPNDVQARFDFVDQVYEVDTALPAYVPPLGREELSLALAWYPFRREDGRYDVYFASAFPVSAIAEQSGHRQFSLSYSASVAVRDEGMSTVWTDQVSTLEEFEGRTHGLSAQNGFSHVLAPGYYHVGGEVISRDSAHHAAAALEGWLVPYAEQVELDLSALVIAASITDAAEGGSAFVRNGKQIVPVPDGSFGTDQPLYFYHEVYSLTPAEDGSCRYRIRYTLYEKKHKRQRVLTEQTFESNETQTFHSGSIPGKTLKKGSYILEAKIDDLIAAKTKVALAGFQIR